LDKSIRNCGWPGQGKRPIIHTVHTARKKQKKGIAGVEPCLRYGRHSRSKTAFFQNAYVPATHVFLAERTEDVDARRKAGHDK